MASARYMAAFSWSCLLVTLVCCHPVQPAPSADSQEHAEIKGVLETILHTMLDWRSEAWGRERLTQLQAIEARLAAVEADQKAANARLTAAERHGQTVAFTASISEPTLRFAADHVIPFRKVVTNVGSAYDPITSSFTAPDDGQYMFFVSVDTNTKYVRLSINKNGKILLRGHNDGGQSSHITAGGVFTLKAGDKVAVHHGTGTMEEGAVVDGGPEAIFTGFKI